MKPEALSKLTDPLRAMLQDIHACQPKDDADLRRLALRLKKSSQNLATAARRSELNTCEHVTEDPHKYSYDRAGVRVTIRRWSCVKCGKHIKTTQTESTGESA
jgi:hypothetical protein